MRDVISSSLAVSRNREKCLSSPKITMKLLLITLSELWMILLSTTFFCWNREVQEIILLSRAGIRGAHLFTGKLQKCTLSKILLSWIHFALVVHCHIENEEWEAVVEFVRKLIWQNFRFAEWSESPVSIRGGDVIWTGNGEYQNPFP